MIKVKLDNGAKEPTKAHIIDAGFDLYSMIDVIVPPTKLNKESKYGDAIEYRKDTVNIGSVCIDTGVHMEIPRGYAGLLVSKSGLNVKNGITSTGLIDSGYTGSIIVKLYNHTDKPYVISKGDKISQIVLIKISDDSGIEIVDELKNNTERGDNGFGSTGK